VQLCSELIQIDQLCLMINGVGVDIEEMTGDIVAIAMCEVSTGIVVESEKTLIVSRFTYFSPI
jgi:hypothetical protein